MCFSKKFVSFQIIYFIDCSRYGERIRPTKLAPILPNFSYKIFRHFLYPNTSNSLCKNLQLVGESFYKLNFAVKKKLCLLICIDKFS